MAKQKRKRKRRTQNDERYFNFMKFDRLLERLRKSGINVVDEDYEVKSLKNQKTFQSFFEKYSVQEINTHLLFYRKQFDEIEDC